MCSTPETLKRNAHKFKGLQYVMHTHPITCILYIYFYKSRIPYLLNLIQVICHVQIIQIQELLETYVCIGSRQPRHEVEYYNTTCGGNGSTKFIPQNISEVKSFMGIIV